MSAFSPATPHEYGAALIDMCEKIATMCSNLGDSKKDDEIVVGLPPVAWEYARGYVDSVLRKYAVHETERMAATADGELVIHTSMPVGRVRIRRVDHE